MKPALALAIVLGAATAVVGAPLRARAGVTPPSALQTETGTLDEAASDHAQFWNLRGASKVNLVRSLLVGTGGILLGALIVGVIWWFMSRKKAVPSDAASIEEQRKQLLAEVEQLDEAKKSLLEASGEGGGPEAKPEPGATPAEAEPKAEEPEPVDYDTLLRTLTQKAMQEIGPKIAKGQAVRSIIEGKMTEFAGRTRNFVMTELNGTAASLLEAIDAEEAMLLLDWDSAVASNFPPVSVLIAGVLSPTILAVAFLMHLSQVVVVLLPVLVLTLWAIIHDAQAQCGIPFIHQWAYAQALTAFGLLLAHSAIAVKIKMGKKSVREKGEAMRDRIEAASVKGGGFNELRELFICHSVLLQHALLVEDNIRRSIWYWIVGVGTVISLIISIWTFVIVVGWTFVPGTVAFHPNAKAVAAEDFCGAWAIVLTARLSCVLNVLFFFVNMGVVAKWLSDLMVNNDTYANSVLQAAKDADQNMSGMPIMELLTKAIVLRGSSETTRAELAVTLNEKTQLEKQKLELQRNLSIVDKKLAATESKVETLKPKMADGGGGLEDHMKKLEEGTDPESWKEKGTQAAKEAQIQAQQASEATTKALEEMMARIQEAASVIQGDERVQQALAGAQQLGQETMKNLPVDTEAAKAAAQSALKQAHQMGTQALESEAGKAALQKAQEAGRKAADVTKTGRGGGSSST